MHFEWNRTRAERNLKSRRVSFDEAASIFHNPDHSVGERRLINGAADARRDPGAGNIYVRFEDETVWLTQQLMAELFQTSQQNISLHLRNVYAEEELTPQATHKEFLSVRREGTRSAHRRIDFYNHWPQWLVRELDKFDSNLAANQRRGRLIGRELDAALADPRWNASATQC